MILAELREPAGQLRLMEGQLLGQPHHHGVLLDRMLDLLGDGTFRQLPEIADVGLKLLDCQAHLAFLQFQVVQAKGDRMLKVAACRSFQVGDAGLVAHLLHGPFAFLHLLFHGALPGRKLGELLTDARLLAVPVLRDEQASHLVDDQGRLRRIAAGHRHGDMLGLSLRIGIQVLLQALDGLSGIAVHRLSKPLRRTDFVADPDQLLQTALHLHQVG
jgi:hypothetical protein